MSGSSFTLDQNQIDILQECKRHLKNSEIDEWHRSQLVEANNVYDILKNAGFPANDLSESQLDQIFREMRGARARVGIKKELGFEFSVCSL